MAAKKKAKTQDAAPVVIAYKGFGPDWTCRDVKFAVGETYTHQGRVEICNSGFHACENPLDVWSYYPFGCPMAVVEVSGSIDRQKDGDSKLAGATLTVKAELKMPQIIEAAVRWIVGAAKEAVTTGEGANAATTGYRANAATTGYRANAATTGEGANAATTGAHAVAAALGYQSKAKAGVGGAIVLVGRNLSGELLHIKASKVGENGIKPDVWYSLNEAGEFVECSHE
jgi:hypothetical protein